MALYRDLKPGDAIRIGESVVTVEHKSGQRVRLRIDSTQPVTDAAADLPPAPVATLKRPDQA